MNGERGLALAIIAGVVVLLGAIAAAREARRPNHPSRPPTVRLGCGTLLFLAVLFVLAAKMALRDVEIKLSHAETTLHHLDTQLQRQQNQLDQIRNELERLRHGSGPPAFAPGP